MIFLKYDLKTNKIVEAKNIDNDPATALLWKRLYPRRTQFETYRWAGKSGQLDHSARSIMGSAK